MFRALVVCLILTNFIKFTYICHLRLPYLSIESGAKRKIRVGFTKRRALGCVKFLPGPAWLLLSEPGPPFSASLYVGCFRTRPPPPCDQEVGSRNLCPCAGRRAHIRYLCGFSVWDLGCRWNPSGRSEWQSKQDEKRKTAYNVLGGQRGGRARLRPRR